MTALRRRVSRALARWAVSINPDPPFTFTTRRIDTPCTKETAEALAAVLSGQIGGHVGLGYRGPDGTPGTVVRY